MGHQLQEVLPKAGLVYSEKSSLSEILSKPKILPLKSITLERIEEMELRAKKIFEDARGPPESSQGRVNTAGDRPVSSAGRSEPQQQAPPRPTSSAGRPSSSAGRASNNASLGQSRGSSDMASSQRSNASSMSERTSSHGSMGGSRKAADPPPAPPSTSNFGHSGSPKQSEAAARPSSSSGRPASAGGRRLSDPTIRKEASQFASGASVVRSATTRPMSSSGNAPTRDQA
jgi:BBSome-interacting protein 1|uniref:Uncharacterized protein n=1 Tax=Eutreptiella gymnastica TaxID=73025 RepID=A0A7S4FUF1_9EUGL|mmetsp:Transcript_65110/g.108140  ORF Transcript_65110/g.108140 Transcript_65110/m.108140 type:complete len:230 (-) Transcript_65110:280-969(-)|eukprot:CAMPEP_0174282046 /NCGR_PEP_ID=MMETSP0809-20121228/2477_1 /TAXON_ID=73025 ORGANISM="Eutreptiella gymnastica-like, Strain CCMP1594" /NCGR_SAMPLE_ID=MMETSP0809 /ASSEMBLY_ACC=CAM_ASM_000658 /LENGTH=229 /DNA_ID=CAMNT_0015375983 /DNA_START=100 /DNA_END=789 /DNA_ORIENTATION=+